MLNSSYKKKKFKFTWAIDSLDSLAVFDCTLEAGDSLATEFLLFYSPHYTKQINLLQINSPFFFPLLHYVIVQNGITYTLGLFVFIQLKILATILITHINSNECLSF